MEPRGNRAFFYGIFCFLLLPLFAQEPAEAVLLKEALLQRRIEWYPSGVFSPDTALDDLSLLVSPTVNAAEDSLGGDAEKPVLFLAIPLAAARDGGFSFGVDVGLALLDLLNDGQAEGGGSALQVELRVAFLNAAETTYIRRMNDSAGIADLSEDMLLLFLDMPEAPRALDLYYRSQKTQTPLFMLKPFTAFCRTANIPFRLVQERASGGETNAGFAVLDFARMVEADALYLSGAPYVGNTLTPDALAGLVLRCLTVLTTARYNTDRNYSALSLPAGRVFFISETAKMGLAVGIAAFFLAAAVIISTYRRASRRK